MVRSGPVPFPESAFSKVINQNSSKILPTKIYFLKILPPNCFKLGTNLLCDDILLHTKKNKFCKFSKKIFHKFPLRKIVPRRLIKLASRFPNAFPRRGIPQLISAQTFDRDASMTSQVPPESGLANVLVVDVNLVVEVVRLHEVHDGLVFLRE